MRYASPPIPDVPQMLFPRANHDSIYRRLTLTLATLVLLLTILSTCALQYLPDEPLHLRRNLTLYAAFVFVVSGLGLVGGIQVRTIKTQLPYLELQTNNRTAQCYPNQPLRVSSTPGRHPLLHPSSPPSQHILPTTIRPLHHLTTRTTTKHPPRCSLQYPK